jgi:uncharacterized protein YdhG (YjbR/CyaY superfamily)
MSPAKDVDAYLSAAPKRAQPKLKEVRQTLRTLLPEAEEKIWYGVPFYHQDGEVVGFAAYQNHVSLGVGAPDFPEILRQNLKKAGYQTGKGTIQIRFDQNIPTPEIESILKAKLKRNAARKKPAS